MMLNGKHTAGAFALAVALLASTGAFLNEANAVEQKQIRIKDKPRSAARTTSDTIKPTPPTATARGIKDPAIKSCNGCGQTPVRAAAPPPGGTPTPPPAVDIETGQIRIKDKPTGATERQANSGTGGGSPPPPAVDIETGQLLDKGPRWPNKVTERTGRPKERDDDARDTSATERRAHNGPGGTSPATAKNQLCGVPYTPPCVTDATQRSVGTVKKGGPSALALGIGGLAAIAAIVAVASGGTPVSR